MNATLLVMRRDQRELCSTTAFRILLAVSALIALGASAAISIALRRQAWYGEPAARPVLELILGLVVYFVPLLVLVAFIWAFASLPIVQEKANGNLECLLATPLRPLQLWVGKGLAVFLPSLVLCVLATLFVCFAVNLAAVRPGWNTWVLPVPALVTGLLVNPLLFAALLAFVILVAMTRDPDLAIAPSLLVGFGLMMGMPVGVMTGHIDLGSWSFVAWYLAGAGVAWALVLALSGLLTRQAIVLSSRGG
ncbi:MAG: ABC transporter permease [Pseudomonadota bacterium]